LPESQTCFMSLALPAYSEKSIMKQKLLYAISTCKEIDLDFETIDKNDVDMQSEENSDSENSDND